MGEDFFRHAYKSKCKVEVNKAIISDIEAGVRKMIELILQRVQSRCPEFRVADIITTGSFYEGTKIGPPDTFDFMITLARLSGTDKISYSHDVLCSILILNYNKVLILHRILRIMFEMADDKAMREFSGKS